MNRLRTTRLKRPILWIAVFALLLAAVGSQLRVTMCIGDCCPLKAQIAATSCCPATTDTCEDAPIKRSCCDKCSHDEQDPENDPLGDPSNDLGRDGRPDCCVTVDFDIELAPADAPIELPLAVVLALPPTPQSLALVPARQLERLRPFDRGPPRIDRSTAMRACTVLLI